MSLLLTNQHATKRQRDVEIKHHTSLTMTIDGS